MSLFIKRVITDSDGNEYIRWLYNNEQYVSDRLSLNTVRGVVNEADRSKLKRSIDDIDASSMDWYVKVSDIQNQRPAALILYYEEKDTVKAVTISENKRALSGWYTTFFQLLSLTPMQFDRVSGNPYGRFDNSSSSPKRVFVSAKKGFRQRADAVLQSKKRTIHNEFEILSAAPSGFECVSICPEFSVYVPQGAFPKISSPAPKDISAVHTKCFGTRFMRKEKSHTLNLLADPQHVKAWYKTSRNPQQITVMNGQSAGEIAEELGLMDVGFEWLHLVAHSLGPAESYDTPQTIDNLVLGTSAANAQMLELEGQLQLGAILQGYTLRVTVTVDRRSLPNGQFVTWLVEKIHYTYAYLDNVNGQLTVIRSGSVVFDPLQSQPPALSELFLYNDLCGPPSRKKSRTGTEDTLGSSTLKKSFRRIAPLSQASRRAMDDSSSIFGLPLSQVVPCEIVNGNYVPIVRKVQGLALQSAARNSAPQSHDSTPGGVAYTGTVNLLASENRPAIGATLDEGKKILTVDHQVSNFTFDQLFRDFECDNIDLFVLDKVSIKMEEVPGQSTSERLISFSGMLRMDDGPLAVFKEFLKIDTDLYISGDILVGEQDLSEKLEPDYITLSTAGSFHLPLADGITLTAATLQVNIEKKIDLQTLKSGWTISCGVSGTLELTKLGEKPARINCLVTYGNGTLHVVAASGNVQGLFGLDDLILDSIQLQFSLGQINNIELSAYISPGCRTYGFGGIISPSYAGIFLSVSEFTVDDLDDLFCTISGERLALPEYDLVLKNVMISLATADCSVNGTQLRKGFFSTSDLTVHGYNCHAELAISTDGISVAGNLGKISVGPVDVTSSSLQMSLYNASSERPSGFAIAGNVEVEGLPLVCSVSYEKLGDTWNCVLYALIKAKSFALSDMFAPLKGSYADTIKFSKVVVIYSAADAKTQRPDYPFQVRSGLQLMAIVEEIPELSKLAGTQTLGLELCAHLGAQKDISISMPETRLHLSDSVTCDPFKVIIALAPKPDFELVFGLEVNLAKQDPLHFDFSLSIDVIEARGAATMKGWWNQPFGVKGLKIGPAVALQIGIIYEVFIATGLPSEFGIAGGIQMGEATGELAINISENPEDEILKGSIKKLTARDLVSFGAALTGVQIPGDNVPDFFDIELLELYCAPNGGTIGTIVYDPGFSFSANLMLFGKRISIYTRFLNKSVVAMGHLDRLEIGPLQVTGKKGKDAELDFELTDEKQSIHIDGAFEFLGTGIGLFVDISKNSIYFEFEEKFLEVFVYTIQGRSVGTITDLTSLDFLLSAEFDNDLTAYLKNTLARKIQDAINAVDNDIEAAKRKVDEAEAAYIKLYDPAKEWLEKAKGDTEQYLAQLQKDIADLRVSFPGKLQEATEAVVHAEAVYNDALNAAKIRLLAAQTAYDSVMRDAEAEVSSAQANYDAAMVSAEQRVTDAERAYHDALGSAEQDVRAANDKVSSLQNEIDSSANELDNLRWYEIPYMGPYLSGKIAVLEISMRSAQLALTLAEKFLEGIDHGSEYVIWTEAMGALEVARWGVKYGALERAKDFLEVVRVGGEYGVLETAKQAVGVIQTGSEYTIWQTAIKSLEFVKAHQSDALTLAEQALGNYGHSAVNLAFEDAKKALEAIEHGTAALTFENAKLALTAVEKGADAVLGLAGYIASHSGDFVDLRKVKLLAHLKGIEQGDLFTAEIEIVLGGRKYNWMLDFDVRSVSNFVENLFKKAFDEALSLTGGEVGITSSPKPSTSNLVLVAEGEGVVVSVNQPGNASFTTFGVRQRDKVSYAVWKPNQDTIIGSRRYTAGQEYSMLMINSFVNPGTQAFIAFSSRNDGYLRGINNEILTADSGGGSMITKGDNIFISCHDFNDGSGNLLISVDIIRADRTMASFSFNTKKPF